MNPSKTHKVAFWAFTGFFSLWMLFTAYAEWALPQVTEAFTHLGFPAPFFRMELSIAKALGVLVLLLPVPPRLKEWAYAGFTIDLVTALVAHLVAGDTVAQYSWPAVACLVLGLSYYFYRKVSPSFRV